MVFNGKNNPIKFMPCHTLYCPQQLYEVIAGNICLLWKRTSPMWSLTIYEILFPFMIQVEDSTCYFHSGFGLLFIPLHVFQILEQRSRSLLFFFVFPAISFSKKPFLSKQILFLFFHKKLPEKNYVVFGRQPSYFL